LGEFEREGKQIMATIGSFFGGKSTKYVAAQQHNKTGDLYYYEADSLTPIPPSVYVWAYTSGRDLAVFKEIMTNYPVSWVNTYSPWEGDYRRWEREDYVKTISLASLYAKNWDQFDLKGLGAKPGLTALYADTLSYAESRARRAYMLAAFCILKKHGRKTYHKSEGHNIGSLLVGNDGEILSWGVNTGGFCHAEVNTILGYFAKNPTADRLPAKSTLFTTLKPCLMCSTLIKNTQNTGSDAKIWFGMIDEGKQGGTPLLGDKANEFDGEDVVDLDVWELLSEKGTLDTAIQVSGSKRVEVPGAKGKFDLTDSLNKSGGGHKARHMSAADWVDKSDEVWKLVEASVNKLKGKIDKPDRDDGPMKRTLEYLKGWAV
jgi:pyrimidine deaminase RibD-like protein